MPHKKAVARLGRKNQCEKDYEEKFSRLYGMLCKAKGSKNLGKILI